MPHPVTNIIYQLFDASDAGDISTASDAFKRQIWHRSFWVAGTNTVADNGEVLVTMDLSDPVNGTNQIISVFVNQEEAVAKFGEDGCFCLTFRVILVFAQTRRMDAYLFEGDGGLLITHDQLLILRDQAALGGEGNPMSEQEVHQHQACATELASRARAYCAGHSDIDSLHLSIIMTTGVTAMVGATLKAGRTQEHADALPRISDELLQPGWRFYLYEYAEGGEGMVGLLKQHPPCFLRARDTGMWNKFKNTFSAPGVGIIQMESDPDPTAMALDDTQVPEWASQ